MFFFYFEEFYGRKKERNFTSAEEYRFQVDLFVHHSSFYNVIETFCERISLKRAYETIVGNIYKTI